jgi:hypothetical protein
MDLRAPNPDIQKNNGTHAELTKLQKPVRKTLGFGLWKYQ